MVEVNWTARTLEDLDDIAKYISKNSVRYAKLTIERCFYQQIF